MGAVEGLGSYLEVASSGEEAAPDQTVHLRLRKDAPLGPIQGLHLRLRIEPAGETIDCRVTAPSSLRSSPIPHASSSAASPPPRRPPAK
ncbi:MAG: hypothetical protein HC813_01685 [Planctomycetes bacterium]|nr:hypothetical protein [Planctomycetota bacterium]